MEIATFEPKEIAMILESVSKSMPNGYRLYDFGGGCTVITVPDPKTGFMKANCFGIERISDQKVQMFEIKETING
jgi:hypothetical protein